MARHFLTNLSEENLTATCSICGQVSIHLNRPKNKKAFWVCARRLVKPKHVISNINLNEEEADCSICGHVSIYYNKPSKGKAFWTCGRKLRPKRNPEHVITNVCEKTKTGHCAFCGWVNVAQKIQKNKYKYWSCDNYKGNQNKKVKFHRKMKKDKCEVCGFKPEHLCQLDIHHINEDHYDDRPENMQTVCCNCHRLISIKTPEQINEERIAKLLEHRWLILLNDQKYIFNNDLEIIKNNQINTSQRNHILNHICTRSKTAYCTICGLTNIKIVRAGSGNKYWYCDRYQETVKKKKDYKNKANLLNKFYEKHKKKNCEKCNFIAKDSRQLDIHHIDHNHDNNEILNLRTLCANCHRAEHAYIPEQTKQEREVVILLLRKIERCKYI